MPISFKSAPLRLVFRMVTILLLSGFLAACESTDAAPAMPDGLQPAQKSLVPPPADGFDFPVGPPNAKGYYNAQKFTKNDHLGDDWNGTGGGNSDLGDPVYAAAHGIVLTAHDFEGGWGNIVRLLHNVGDAEEPVLIETLYGHLDTILVAVGDTLRRGQQIGTIGNAHGKYWAHLHLELRTTPFMEIGGGYDSDTTGFTDPTAYIRAHRPKK